MPKRYYQFSGRLDFIDAEFIFACIFLVASCPNSCSGHGVCGTIHDISYFYGPDYNSLTSFAGDGYGLNYNYWDKYSSALCDCDTGYFGADCSLGKALTLLCIYFIFYNSYSPS